MNCTLTPACLSVVNSSVSCGGQSEVLTAAAAGAGWRQDDGLGCCSSSGSACLLAGLRCSRSPCSRLHQIQTIFIRKQDYCFFNCLLTLVKIKRALGCRNNSIPVVGFNPNGCVSPCRASQIHVSTTHSITLGCGVGDLLAWCTVGFCLLLCLDGFLAWPSVKVKSSIWVLVC